MFYLSWYDHDTNHRQSTDHMCLCDTKESYGKKKKKALTRRYRNQWSWDRLWRKNHFDPTNWIPRSRCNSTHRKSMSMRPTWPKNGRRWLQKKRTNIVIIRRKMLDLLTHSVSIFVHTRFAKSQFVLLEIWDWTHRERILLCRTAHHWSLIDARRMHQISRQSSYKRRFSPRNLHSVQHLSRWVKTADHDQFPSLVGITDSNWIRAFQC